METASCNKNQEHDVGVIRATKSVYKPWTKEEDLTLGRAIREIENSGKFSSVQKLISRKTFLSRELSTEKTKFWNLVAGSVPGRTAKQCRERWKNSLDPSIIQDAWSIEEDLQLRRLHGFFGNKWSKIAAQLKGRTENGVKTRFKSISRAQKRQWTPQEDALLLQMYRQHGPNWPLIQSQVSTRSLHGVKVRYRALISGTTQTEVSPGSPEQSLAYDCGTSLSYDPNFATSQVQAPFIQVLHQSHQDQYDDFFSPGLQHHDHIHEGPFYSHPLHYEENPVSNKRDLINLLLEVNDDIDNQKSIGIGPTVIPGFKAQSEHPVKVAKVSGHIEREQEHSSSPSNEALQNNACKVNDETDEKLSSTSFENEKQIEEPTFHFACKNQTPSILHQEGKRTHPAKDCSVGDTVEQEQPSFTSVIFNILDSAKADVNSEENDLGEFESSLIDMLHDSDDVRVNGANYNHNMLEPNSSKLEK